MKPQSHLSLPEEVGKALTEAQLAALDGLGAAATLGAAACGGCKEMCHSARIFQVGAGREAIAQPRCILLTGTGCSCARSCCPRIPVHSRDRRSRIPPAWRCRLVPPPATLRLRT